MKLLLSPLGFGRIQAIAPANPPGRRPHPRSGSPIIADKAGPRAGSASYFLSKRAKVLPNVGRADTPLLLFARPPSPPYDREVQ